VDDRRGITVNTGMRAAPVWIEGITQTRKVRGGKSSFNFYFFYHIMKCV
jgi:hypothetical protein